MHSCRAASSVRECICACTAVPQCNSPTTAVGWTPGRGSKRKLGEVMHAVRHSPRVVSSGMPRLSRAAVMDVLAGAGKKEVMRGCLVACCCLPGGDGWVGASGAGCGGVGVGGVSFIPTIASRRARFFLHPSLRPCSASTWRGRSRGGRRIPFEKQAVPWCVCASAPEREQQTAPRPVTGPCS